MQEQLDATIHHHHHQSYESTLYERILALLVELGELANETRCFKYWSIKGASPKEVILEEYSDGIHFLLSLGIHFQCDYDYPFAPRITEANLTKLLVSLFFEISYFARNPSLESYTNIMNLYLGLGVLLEIDEVALVQAYIAKNKVNYERQKNQY
jgi:dimeric dUTPase (all-alpha-NTP-PPase superfamily)